MAENNKLELVVEADVNKATSIKSINTGLSSMQQGGGEGCAARLPGLTSSLSAS